MSLIQSPSSQAPVQPLQAASQKLVGKPALSGELLGAIFRVSPIGILITTLDEGRVIEVNDAFLDLTGYTRAEVIGRTTLEIRLWNNVEQRAALINSTSPQGVTRDLEQSFSTKDGQARIGLINAEHLPIEHETYLLVMMQDITARKQMEETLRATTTDLKHAQAMAQVGSWRINVIHNELRWSDEVYRIFGVAPGTPLTYESFLNTIHPDDKAYVQAQWNAALHGAPYDIVHRILVKGVVKWVHEQAELEFDAQGTLLGGFGSVQDITNRKLAEEEIRRSESLYRAIARNLPGGGVLLVNKDMRYLIAEGPVWARLGTPAEQLEGHFVREVLDEKTTLIWEERYRQVLAGETHSYETEHSGRTLWFQYLPLRDEQKRVMAAMVLAQDITTQKRAESQSRAALEALQVSEQQLRELTQALELDRARLATVLENLPVGVWIADSDGRLIGKNPQADRIWSGDAPLLEGVAQYHTYRAWYAESGQPLSDEDYPMAHTLRTGLPVNPVKLRIQRFDGTEGTILVSSAPIRDMAGNLTGVVAVNMDITARQQAEAQKEAALEALRYSEERFNKAFNVNPNAQVISSQSDGRIYLVNYRFERLFGYRRGEVIGKTSRELHMFANPADHDEALRRLHTNRYLHDFEINIQTKSGEIRIASLSIELISFAGESWLLTVIEDITERKQAEGFRLWLASFPELNPNPVVEIDLSGQIEYLNPAARHLIPDLTVKGQQHPWLADLVEIRQRLKEGEAQSLVREVTLDAVTYQQTLQYVTSTQRVRIYAMDITSRKQAEAETEAALTVMNYYAAELQTRNEDLNAFAHTVAHDLKNPLNVVIGYSELLAEDAADESTSNLADLINQGARKMAHIIDDLLLLAGVRQAEVEHSPVDMAAVVAESLRRLADMIAAYQPEIHLPETWPVALGYAPWIEEVWLNYLSNALKYGGRPPHLVLGSEVLPDGLVRFWVQDNGQGIAPEAQAQLFTAFNVASELRGTGHGVGLSIVRRIVEKLGGQVAANNNSAGPGSVFSFTLPRA